MNLNQRNRLTWVLTGMILLGSCLLPLSAEGLKKVVLQLKWHHQFQFAGYYAADLMGFYEEEGFKVEMREGENVDTVEEVLSGDADFGIALSDLVVDYKQGKPVVAVATIFQHSPLVLIRREHSAVGTVHDLEGNRVMLETHSEELEAYLAEMGVSFEGLVHFPYKNAIESLLSEKVDAISAYITDEPFILEQKGMAFQLNSPRAVGIDFYGDTLFTTRAMAEKHSGTVNRFRRATLRGWEYALRNPQEIISYILEQWPEGNDRDALNYEAEKTQKLIRDDLVEIGYMNPGRWQHIADVYADLGIATHSMDLETFLYSENPPFPLKKVLWVVAPLSVFLLIAIVIALHQRKQRKIQSETLKKIQLLEGKLSTLLTNMPGLAYRCRNDGKDWVMEYISEGALELTGYSPRELIGSEGVTFGSIIHPDDTTFISKEVAESTSIGKRFRLQYRIKHLDGSYRWVWEQGMLVESGTDGGMLEGFICDITEQKSVEAEKDEAFKNLRQVLEEIKVLKGIIPICSSCKKIRDDQGAWQQLESYIKANSEADFSHGICPDCIRELYPDFVDRTFPEPLDGDSSPIDSPEK